MVTNCMKSNTNSYDTAYLGRGFTDETMDFRMDLDKPDFRPGPGLQFITFNN